MMGIGAAANLPALIMAATLVSFIFIIPGIAVGVRRMHDVGKSGWFVLIPIYNLILACTDSQPGSNQYGPNPKSSELELQDHLIT